MQRRQILKLGAVASGVFAVGGIGRLSGGVAGAQPMAAPTVDRLVMTCVVDNIYDIFAKGGRLDTITVQRTPPPGGRPLLAEHGLAYHLESLRGAERREILLDFAYRMATLTYNYSVLKVEPTNADALIISHGHLDHYGALPELTHVAQGRWKPGLTAYAGGEDTFCHRMGMNPAGVAIDQGQLDRAGLERRGLKVMLAKQPTVVAGQAITSGQIARTTDFERPPAAARLVAGPMDSACSPTHFGATKVEIKPGELVPDTFQGEHASAYHVKDRGLVVITSCGHAGVINSTRQIQKVTGIEKVHAIVGGFHLAPAPDEIVAKTVAAFKEINPDYIIPMHCTGLNTIIAVHREMPKKLVMPSTGTRVIFGG
jgi:7,8-dihydropterin-6-yl-methyl-4-(beta-D-ribofuranosyl)aminobenzene 5'-phosphate synthase